MFIRENVFPQPTTLIILIIYAHRGGGGGIIPLLRVQKKVTGQRFLEDYLEILMKIHRKT